MVKNLMDLDLFVELFEVAAERLVFLKDEPLPPNNSEASSLSVMGSPSMQTILQPSLLLKLGCILEMKYNESSDFLVADIKVSSFVSEQTFREMFPNYTLPYGWKRYTTPGGMEVIKIEKNFQSLDEY